MRCKRMPRCPMLLQWPQAWFNGQPASPQSAVYYKDVDRRPRSRCTHSAFRFPKSKSSSPLKRVTHVKSLSPSIEGTLSPPLYNSPDRYRSSSIDCKFQNNVPFSLAHADADHGDAAYFSSRPPPEPIHLIFTTRNGFFIGNEISVNSLDTCSSSKNIFPTSKFSCKHAESSISEKSKPRKIQKMVRRLLRTFIQNLPLGYDAEESSQRIVPTFGSTTMIVGSEIEQRSVSTQALAPSTTISVGNSGVLYNETEDVVRKKKKEKKSSREWKGGIRALRESHLRLLMRQVRHLRYIERLDRSLKRS